MAGITHNIALILQYDGTRYHGWQLQKDLPTICGTLENAMDALKMNHSRPVGCGRTDAGVHAEFYVTNFFSDTTIPVERLPAALNSKLPYDIAVLDAYTVDYSFNAIGSCIRKEYTYRIYNAPIRNPFYTNRALFYPKPLDLDTLSAACAQFTGTHDFSAVRSAGSDTLTSVRTVFYFFAQRSANNIIELKVSADGFLYNMVRAMTGCVLYLCEGKIHSISDVLASKNRQFAGPTVPPWGLYMTGAWYF